MQVNCLVRFVAQAVLTVSKWMAQAISHPSDQLKGPPILITFMNSKVNKMALGRIAAANLMMKISGMALSALALGAHAQTYQSAWSSASVNEIYTERADNLYGNGLMLSATHYFAPVKMDHSQPFD